MRSSIHRARKQLEALRLALLSPSPQGIEQQLPALEQATQCLDAARQQESLSPGACREQLRALELELRIVTRLIVNGAPRDMPTPRRAARSSPLTASRPW